MQEMAESKSELEKRMANLLNAAEGGTNAAAERKNNIHWVK